MTTWTYWRQPIEGDFRIREGIGDGSNHRIVGFVLKEEDAKSICDLHNAASAPSSALSSKER